MKCLEDGMFKIIKFWHLLNNENSNKKIMFRIISISPGQYNRKGRIREKLSVTMNMKP